MARSECTVCNLVFSSIHSFDKHRTGNYAERTRRCLTVDEMKAKGMAQNEKGIWVTALFEGDSSFWKKKEVNE